MIRIGRGTEPAALVAARARHLPAAIQAYNLHGAGSRELTDLLVGYNPRKIKDQLYLAQAKKCAWCERRRDYSSSPVDHFRPKDGAWRHKRGARRHVDRGHYWWLTWTWTNLLFVCPRCNDRGHKASYFPLTSGSSPLMSPRRPYHGRLGPALFRTSSERPLLLDPVEEDPLDHITWRPLQTKLERQDWKWSPWGKSARGQATIDVLKLGELADEVEDHLRTVVLPSLEEIEAHFTAGRTAAGAARWKKLLAGTLAPNSDLSAATWCALEIWMPAAKRKRWRLSAPHRPGSRTAIGG
jgi:uncharacterized protein (TIGR02646 family)